MLKYLFQLFFGSKEKRDLRDYAPFVEEVNSYCDEWFGPIPFAMDESYNEGGRGKFIRFCMRPVTRPPTPAEIEKLDSILKGKTAEFRKRLQDGETVDEILAEAFAAVKLACFRMIGEKWMAGGSEITWDMVPYDVQIMGGKVLHEGKIAEMATGEGKTLVALAPVYANALLGKGVHVVTVNDYLARRDAEWMGHIHEYLGLTVGCLDKTQPQTPQRRDCYQCDITYGTNNEFGFDYLRDNMSVAESQLTQYVPPNYLREYMEGLFQLIHASDGAVQGLLGDAFSFKVHEKDAGRVLNYLGGERRFGIEEIEIMSRNQALGERLDAAHPAAIDKFSADEALEELEVQFQLRLRMHGHHYAIIDEVDNILIDEARTPLIISGQVDRSTHRYDVMKPLVANLVKKQQIFLNKHVEDARAILEAQPESYEGAAMLFRCQLGAPKHRVLARIKQDPAMQRAMQKVELDYIAWKKNPRMANRDMTEIDEELFYVIDEKGHTIDLTEKGRVECSPDNPDRFLLLDLVEEVVKVDQDATLTPEQKEAKKQELRETNELRQEELHNISQLLRAYSLYEKDTEYVVQDNRVLIVDEFTGRILEGRRYSDGLHQAIEAKENVQIEKETQTLATVTLQNYFRMYGKLAGMTGTAMTEAGEFLQIYKMDVTQIPQNKPTGRFDHDDLIYRSRKEKYNAIIDEIVALHEMRLPVLVGTVSVEVSETLSRMLARRKISHNVLNAKNHSKESEIIRDAGRPGQVTIATNMAGRGTDIKLQPGELMQGREKISDVRVQDAQGNDYPYGLQVIGTERHEARRIDLQLRGRSGRQGDPGASQFFISLEDDLMRLFASERIISILERFGLGLEEGEPIQHRQLTKAVARAQKKVEGHHFEIRKRTLDYDEVMNKQRQAIYGLRREVLTSRDPAPLIVDACLNALEELLPEYGVEPRDMEKFDADGLRSYLQHKVLYVDFAKVELERAQSRDELLRIIEAALHEAYAVKKELLGAELMLRLAKYVMLSAIDQNWRDHLLGIDEVRESVWMESFAQTEPLVAFRKKAGEIFLDLQFNFNRQILEHVYTMQVALHEERGRAQPLNYRKENLAGGPQAAGARSGGNRAPGKPQPVRVEEKINRNAPCPCGSGKKYKKCCGRPGANPAPGLAQ